MKNLLQAFLFLIMPFVLFANNSNNDNCPVLEEEASFSTLVKICNFAFLSANGSGGSGCSVNTVELDVNMYCQSTGEATVRGVNLAQSPVVGEEYPIPPGMADIYYRYEMANSQSYVIGPIDHLTYNGESIEGANGVSYDLFEFNALLYLDIFEYCQNSQTPLVPLNIRLEDANGELYPIGYYAGSGQMFYCQVFEETCSNCNENVIGCNGGSAPEYDVMACGECDNCEENRRSEEEESPNLVNEEFSIDLEVQPNPFDEFFNVKFNLEKETEVSLEIIGSKGEVIHRINKYSQLGEQTLSIDASNFATGIYICRLKVGAEVFTEKMVKFR